MSADSQVVVIGSGIAGLSAAVAAQEAGAHVTLLERAPAEDSGGNTRFTEAYLRMKSVDEVADDFEERLLEDFMGYPDPSLVSELNRQREAWPPMLASMGIADPEVVLRFSREAGPTLRWMTGYGITFSEIATQFLTTSTSRIAPSGGGQALVESMRRAAEKAGVTFEYQTTARGLLTEGSAVEGVRATGPDGAGRSFRGSVVLACGGFEGNYEMLARYTGFRALHCRPVCRGGYYNKGEGIQMALDIGAAPAGNFGMFHAEPIDPRSGLSEPSIMIFPYGILVNRHGERFVDEARGPVDATYEAVTREIFMQPNGIAHVILDAKLADIANAETAIRTDQPPYRADTIEDLAALLGMPQSALAQTVAEYNAACGVGEFDAARVDGLGTKALHPAKSNWARPIDSPPYRSYPIIAANVFTYGGLKINPDAQVISHDGRVIQGLYAAGETVGLYFTNYAGSTSVLKGAVFGRIAGRTAAGAP